MDDMLFSLAETFCTYILLMWRKSEIIVAIRLKSNNCTYKLPARKIKEQDNLVATKFIF